MKRSWTRATGTREDDEEREEGDEGVEKKTTDASNPPFKYKLISPTSDSANRSNPRGSLATP